MFSRYAQGGNRLPRVPLQADANGRILGPFGGRNPEAAEVWEDEIRRLFGRYSTFTLFTKIDMLIV